jgi:hypothetical protein
MDYSDRCGTSVKLDMTVSVLFPGRIGHLRGPGWDPTTGLGSPTADQLAHYLIQFVSPGDGAAAMGGSMPSDYGNPSTPGQLKPH